MHATDAELIKIKKDESASIDLSLHVQQSNGSSLGYHEPDANLLRVFDEIDNEGFKNSNHPTDEATSIDEASLRSEPLPLVLLPSRQSFHRKSKTKRCKAR